MQRPDPDLVMLGSSVTRRIAIRPLRGSKPLRPSKVDPVLSEIEGFRKLGERLWSWEEEKRWLFMDLEVVLRGGKLQELLLTLYSRAIPAEGDQPYREVAERVADALLWQVVDPRTGKRIGASWSDRAEAAAEAGDYERAVELYRKDLAEDPKSSQTWYNMGVDLSRLDRHAEAIKAYDRANRLEPTERLHWLERGKSLRSLGRLQEALASLDKSIEIDPKYGPTWSDRGNVLGDLGRPEEALKSYRKAVKLDPSLPLHWTNFGYGLNMLGRHQEAMKQMDEAIARDPKDGFSWYNKACTACWLKDKPGTLDALRKAISLDPDIRRQAPGEEELSWLHQDRDFKELCAG